MWPVLGSVADGGGSVAGHSAGQRSAHAAGVSESGFGCGRLETAGAYRAAAAVQVYSAVGWRLPGRRAVGRWAAAILLMLARIAERRWCRCAAQWGGGCRVIKSPGFVTLSRFEPRVWQLSCWRMSGSDGEVAVLGSEMEAAVSPGSQPGGLLQV